MSRARYFLAALLIVPLLGAQTTTPHQVIPGGTQINVQLVEPLSSGTAAEGQTFPVRVAEPVVVNHHVVIAKGAPGMGRVVKVQKASGKAPGEITIEIAHVRAVDNSLVHVHTYTKHVERYEYGKAHTATVVSSLLTGPFGLFAHNMVKGKDVTLPPQTVMPAYTSADSPVEIPH